MCGANSCDWLNDKLYDRMKDSPMWVGLINSQFGPSAYYRKQFPWKLVDNGYIQNNPTPFDQDSFVEQRFLTMCSQIDEVVEFIHHHYEGLKLFGLSIIKRRNWYPIIDTMSARLNGYMSKKHKIRMCQMNGRIPDDHFETDEIHLNVKGFGLVWKQYLLTDQTYKITFSEPG